MEGAFIFVIAFKNDNNNNNNNNNNNKKHILRCDRLDFDSKDNISYVRSFLE